ncbi:MAG: hypothetical protein ACK4PK_03565 [Alphaproteobacteria bacterium]
MTFLHSFQRLADELTPCTLRRVPVLSADKYVLASGLQKSIRRGEVNRAASFALSLAHADRRMLWRRLLVIVFEDIGIANPELMIQTLAASQSPLERRKAGDVEVAVHLAKKMAGSVKSRFMTEALSLTDLGQGLSSLRKSLPKLSNRKLATITLDPAQDAQTRFLALWGLAGTKAFPAKGFKREAGDLIAAAKTLRALPVPEELTEACIAGLKSMPWPLVLFAPLAAAVVQTQDCRIKTTQPCSSPEFEGIPMYAIDGLYTRLGQASLRQLQKQTPALEGYSPVQMGETLFFIEGEGMNRRLTSDSLSAFRLAGIEALMTHLGLTAREYRILQKTIIRQWDTLNDLRLRQFERSLHGAAEGLFAGVSGGADDGR